MFCVCLFFFFFKQKTAYEMRISDWSSDVCSSDLPAGPAPITIRSRSRFIVRRSTSPSPEHLSRCVFPPAFGLELAGAALPANGHAFAHRDHAGLTVRLAVDLDEAIEADAHHAPRRTRQAAQRGRAEPRQAGGEQRRGHGLAFDDRDRLVLDHQRDRPAASPLPPRSEARRVGKEWVSTCSSRWEPSHYK